MERTLLIHPDMPNIENEHGFPNINGPSLVRVPDWVENPLGKYYLYFAHHRGSYIRLAYADDIIGPYTVYPGGALHRDNTVFKGCDHIASPDVHIDEDNKKIHYVLSWKLPRWSSHLLGNIREWIGFLCIPILRKATRSIF